MPSARTGKKVAAISTNRKGEQVVVFTSGEKLVLSQAAFTEVPLYVGKELSPLEQGTIRSFERREKYMNYAMGLLSKREYSSKEVREKLIAKGADLSLTQEVIFYLRKEGFLDDKQFAADYAESQSTLLYGEERIKDKLRYEKGINPSIVEELSFPDEDEHAASFLKTLLRKTSSLPYKARKRKLEEMMRRRGFAAETASTALLVLEEDEEAVRASLQKVAASVIKRYERKYNGYELKQRCFAFLLSKGYSSTEISEVLGGLL